MTSAVERYSCAVSSRDLSVDPRTWRSDSDMLGAAGLASIQNPLALALARLFAGDDREQRNIAAILAQDAWSYAKRRRVRLLRTEADDLAKAGVAWGRHGAGGAGGGHGCGLIGGKLGDSRATIGDAECMECRGAGRRPLEREFHSQHRPIATWLAAEIEREQSKAGAAVMAKLAERM